MDTTNKDESSEKDDLSKNEKLPKDLIWENNSNFYMNKDNHLDYLIKISTNLKDILAFDNSKVQGGISYRHTGLNFLVNFNLCHNQSTSSSNTVEEKKPDNKIKVGFVKQHSFSNDLQIIFGSRMNFIFQGLGNNFQFDNLKASAGVIHRDAEAYLHFTKPKYLPLKKIRSNFLVKLLPGLNIFGDASYSKEEGKKEEYSFSLGNQIEYGKKSEIKVKITNQKEVHFTLKRKIDQNLDFNFMGNLSLKENSKETHGKIEPQFGFNITYSDY